MPIGTGVKKIGGDNTTLGDSAIVLKGRPQTPTTVSFTTKNGSLLKIIELRAGGAMAAGIDLPANVEAHIEARLVNQEGMYDLLYTFSLEQIFSRGFNRSDWELVPGLDRLTAQQFYERYGSHYITEEVGVRTIDVFVHIHVESSAKQIELLGKLKAPVPGAVPVPIGGTVTAFYSSVFSLNEITVFFQTTGFTEPKLIRDTAERTLLDGFEELLKEKLVTNDGALVGIDPSKAKHADYSTLGVNALTPYLEFDNYLDTLLADINTRSIDDFGFDISTVMSRVAAARRDYAEILVTAYRTLKAYKDRKGVYLDTVENYFDKIDGMIMRINEAVQESKVSCTELTSVHSRHIRHKSRWDPLGLFAPHQHTRDTNANDFFKIDLPQGIIEALVILRAGTDNRLKTFKLKQRTERGDHLDIIPSFTLRSLANDDPISSDRNRVKKLLRNLLKDSVTEPNLHCDAEMEYLGRGEGVPKGEGFYIKALSQKPINVFDLRIFCLHSQLAPTLALSLLTSDLKARLRAAAAAGAELIPEPIANGGAAVLRP